MLFHHPDARFFVPDGAGEDTALARMTHLGIGAHPDDLEFMALHGILAGYRREDARFGGVTCANGGPYEVAERRNEQDEAACIGDYSFMVQLGYSSAEVKDTADDRLTRDLILLLSRVSPCIVYTHNPADKHDTHVAVVARVVRAIRALPPAQRPHRLLGCEVWRDLDWMLDEDKVRLDVSTDPVLAEKLAAVFKTQLSKKRYDLAVRGRELANATFYESHEPDGPARVWHAMDLTPLVNDDQISLTQFTNRYLARFKNDIMERLNRYA
ncbi:MAG: PIG-L deacetylase family protein [Kiritimatiellia bacterium]